MQESIVLTKSRSRNKIRDGIHHYTLHRNLDKGDYLSKLTFEDGQFEESGQVQNPTSHKSYGEISVFPTVSELQHSRDKTNQNSRFNNEKELSKPQNNTNFHHNYPHILNIKYNIHYDGNSSENTESIYFGDTEQNNTSDGNISGSEKTMSVFDYDADDEDINIQGTNLSIQDQECMTLFCNKMNKNCENLQSNELSTLMESLFLNGHYAREDKSFEKDTYTSKQILNKQLHKEMVKNSNIIHKQRQKRAIPQLALLIPMMEDEDYVSEDVSSKSKRCIKKSCRKDLCRRMGCHANEQSRHETYFPEETYETEYNAPTSVTDEKMKQLSQPHDSTLLNYNTDMYRYNTNGFPAYRSKFVSEPKRERNHKDSDISQNKFHKLLDHHKERKYHQNIAPLQESHFSDQQEDDYSSSDSSLQIHLQDCAQRLKKWLNARWERGRSQNKLLHWNPHQQVLTFKHQQQNARSNSHEQLGSPISPGDEQQSPTSQKDSDNVPQEKHTGIFIKNNSKEYFSLPRENAERQSSIVNLLPENKSTSENETYLLSESDETITSYSSKQQEFRNRENKQLKEHESVTIDFHPTHDKLGDNKLHSSFHYPNNALHHTEQESFMRNLPRAREHSQIQYDHKSIARDNYQTEYNPTTKNHSESSDKHFVSSTNNDQLSLPAKMHEELPTSYGNTYSSHTVHIPTQLTEVEHVNKNSGILQLTNLQEIYKNLPHDYEFSAGQWIHIKPSNRSPNIQPDKMYRQTGEIHPSIENNTSTHNLTGYDYGNHDTWVHKSPENNDKISPKSSKVFDKSSLSNEFTNITVNVTERDQVKYRSQSDSELLKPLPSEENTEPANIETHNTNIYLPMGRAIPIYEAKDKFPSTEQTTGGHSPMGDKNYSIVRNTSQNTMEDVYPFSTMTNTKLHPEETTTLIPEEKLDEYTFPKDATISKTNELINMQPTESLTEIQGEAHKERKSDIKPYTTTEILTPLTSDEKYQSGLFTTEEIPTTTSQHFQRDSNNKSRSHELRNAIDSYEFGTTEERMLQYQLAELHVSQAPDYGFKKSASDSEIVQGQHNVTSENVVDILTTILTKPEQVPSTQAYVYYSSERPSINGSDETSYVSSIEKKSFDVLQSLSSETSPLAPEMKSQTSGFLPEHRQADFTQTDHSNQKYTSLQLSHTTISSETTNTTEILGDNTHPIDHTRTTIQEVEHLSQMSKSSHHVHTPVRTFDSEDTKYIHEGTSPQKGEPYTYNKYDFDYRTLTHSLSPSTSMRTMSSRESIREQPEYSGTLLIVDPTTGVVTETIPVIGRVLTLGSEQNMSSYHNVTFSTYQPQTTYLTTSQGKYTVSNTVVPKDELLHKKLPQDASTHFSIEIVHSTPRTLPVQDIKPEVVLSANFNNSLQKERTVNVISEDSEITPSALRLSLESPVPLNATDDAQQVRSDVPVALPDLNITCLKKDPPCELAQNDVYKNFFTVMINELQRLGKENCSQNCTGSKIVPACEQCIKNLIDKKINDQSTDEEVKNFAVKHCPEQEITVNKINNSSAEQASSAPYTKCKYKFIADLTSLFGLWLKAITNSR